ncbi:MAG TPA: cytochrome c biogenesis protein CcdA [Melioribacteraceae bacterium]|nr:cytochrome c biogenesis protein CcdA [Melioribacteraceae bacterium]
MIDAIFNLLYDAINASALISIFAAFGWGLMSIILSPCHLSSIPLVVGFISSQETTKTGRVFFISFIFSLGILVTIALIGIITAYLGRMLGDIGIIGNYFVAVIFFVVGLYFLDILSLNWNFAGLRKINLKGLPAAFILGLLFGLALGPCTFAFMAPVLSIVFQTAQTNFIISVLLLTGFAIGHCAVIVVAGTLSSYLPKYINSASNSKSINIIKKVCGVLVILAGVYFIYTTF